MILTAIVLLQSCAAGLSNALGETGEMSGTAGMILSVLMLTGGIVQVATRKSYGNGGSIAGIIIFGLAALVGFIGAGSFTDLNIWASWCAILALLNVLSLFVKPSKRTKVVEIDEK